MTRIQPTDTVQNVLMNMSEGNPGALTCLIEMMQKNDWYAQMVTGLEYIWQLDKLGIYGSKIYMLWNDCCGRNLEELETVLWNQILGHLTVAKIHENLSSGYGKPFLNMMPLDVLLPAIRESRPKQNAEQEGE